jgi:hypothetical protein
MRVQKSIFLSIFAVGREELRKAAQKEKGEVDGATARSPASR